MERTEETTDIPADLVYGGEELFSDNGERLELRDSLSNLLIDLVDCSSEWSAGIDASDYISMERIDSTISGSDPENWLNNDPIIYQQGLDAAGNLVSGTPKAKNSAAFLGKIIYVDDDFEDDLENHRWKTIQKGIDDAEPSYLVLVNSGTYRENNVVIEKQLILRGTGNKENPVIIDAKKDAGRADGILVKVDEVIIEGFKIKNTQAGIRLLNSNENILKNNVFEQNNYGIYLENSNNNILFRNNVKTMNCGIHLSSSNNNTLEENITNDQSLSNNTTISTHGICLISSKENILKNNESQNNKETGDGIYLKDSDFNQLEGNFAAENQNGISLINSKGNGLENNKTENNKSGIYLDYNSNENSLKNNLMNNNCIANLNVNSQNNEIDESNLVDGKTVYYLQNQSDLVIDSSFNPGLIYCFNCQNIVIKDITIDNRNSRTIYFYRTNNSFIENVKISESVRAIFLEESHNNTIKGNLIKKNFNGIFLLKSNENKILDNIAEENGSQGDSPCFSGSPRFGLHLSQSNQNEIFNNLIINNPDGVELYDSRDNILFENTIEGNNDGIKIYRSVNNLFYHNNFVNNQKNVWDSHNQWEGNYYSDYDEPEEGCNDLNSDNICDELYPQNRDEYPFLQKNGWSPPPP